jgi:hypothetical protein
LKNFENNFSVVKSGSPESRLLRFDGLGRYKTQKPASTPGIGLLIDFADFAGIGCSFLSNQKRDAGTFFQN